MFLYNFMVESTFTQSPSNQNSQGPVPPKGQPNLVGENRRNDNLVGMGMRDTHVKSYVYLSIFGAFFLNSLGWKLKKQNRGQYITNENNAPWSGKIPSKSPYICIVWSP